MRHEAFWLAVTTIAPVLLLAHAVAVNRFSLAADAVLEAHQRRLRGTVRQTEAVEAEIALADAEMDRLDELSRRVDRRRAFWWTRWTAVWFVAPRVVEHSLETRRVAVRMQRLKAERDDLVKSVEFLNGMRSRVKKTGWASLRLRSVALLSWSCCAAVIGFALGSLIDGADFVDVHVAMVLMLVPVVGLGLNFVTELSLRTQLAAAGVPEPEVE